MQAPRAQRGLKGSALAIDIGINSTPLSHDDFVADMWAKIASLVPWKEISTRQFQLDRGLPLEVCEVSFSGPMLENLGSEACNYQK